VFHRKDKKNAEIFFSAFALVPHSQKLPEIVPILKQHQNKPTIGRTTSEENEAPSDSEGTID
jgi:hypothetical protein